MSPATPAPVDKAPSARSYRHQGEEPDMTKRRKPARPRPFPLALSFCNRCCMQITEEFPRHLTFAELDSDPEYLAVSTRLSAIHEQVCPGSDDFSTAWLEALCAQAKTYGVLVYGTPSSAVIFICEDCGTRVGPFDFRDPAHLVTARRVFEAHRLTYSETAVR